MSAPLRTDSVVDLAYERIRTLVLDGELPPGSRLRQVELAERVLLSNSGLSRLVDRIEHAGLVERVSCPTDRRSFHVALTDSGAEMLERMWPVYMRGIAEDFLPAVGTNSCEIRQTLEAIGTQCDVAGSEAGELSAARARSSRG